MGTNPFFDNFENPYEQDLAEDLIVESIQMYGMEMYYLPRTLVNVSAVHTEEQVSRFNSNYLIETYIRSVDGFSGGGQMFSSLGAYEIRDRLTFTVSMARFEQEIGQNEDFRLPREGDLIFLPLTGGLYEVRFVEQESSFYQFGKLYTYDLVCELFEYNNEEFSTGIPRVDRVQPDYSKDTLTFLVIDEDGNILTDAYGNGFFIGEDDFIVTQDPLAQNEIFEEETDTFVNFSESNPFSEPR